jgi:hypothetical protein
MHPSLLQARTDSALFVCTDIMRVTTLSGTMVMGLAPVFLLPLAWRRAARVVRPAAWAAR